jgi:hypothetical protein
MHAICAELCFGSAEGAAAVLAGWSVESKAVVHHCIFVSLFEACQLFVKVEHGLEALFHGCMLEWDFPTLPEFFCRTHATAVEFECASVLFFIEHGHFCAAAPAPELLHGLGLLCVFD